MKEISFKSLEGGCVVVSVANTLVANNLEGDEVVTLTRAVTLDCICGKYAAVRDKERKRTEVVKMMINRGNTK